MRTFILAAALSLSACTLPSVVPDAVNTEFKPTGETQLVNRSASFDATRVRSPRCNLAKRSDGTWAGTFDGQPVDVSVYENRLTGVGMLMTRTIDAAGKIVITGQFTGQIFRFELDDQQALIRAPTASVTLPGRTLGQGLTVYGPRGELQLKGEAGLDVAPWPQIAFALMALVN